MGQPNKNRATHERIRRAARFISLDLALQAIAFLVGVAVIRGLPKENYGQYAVYVGILFASILISESGLSNVMLGYASQHPGDSTRTSDLRKSGLYVRRKIGLVSTSTGGLVLVWLLTLNRLGTLETLAALLAYLLSMQAVFVRSNSQVFLRLEGRANSSQKNLLIAAGFRLILIALVMLTMPIQMRFTAIVLLTAVTYWIEAWLMTRSLRSQNVVVGLRSKLHVRRLSRAARRLAPMNFAIVGREQAFLMVMSLAGSTVVLGEISAMTRFAVAFTVVNSFVLNLVLPRLARMNASRAIRAIPIYSAVYLALAVMSVVCVSLFSPILLWVLGDSYKGLNLELTVVMGGSAVLSFCSGLGMMGQSRRWLSGSWFLVASSAIWVVSGPLLFDLRTTMGGALYLATQCLPALMAEVLRFAAGAREVRRSTRMEHERS
ncbi:hypothetical protein [Arthrobacter sp. MA-N2]|uniref:hypothetical protein n=1 Tax=Arthrobacter sp. MA-N2 TaxID=1101188 RepID=UPI0012DDD22D|nr:hypothetical protein [Arthrobacter sp. MA-N2]